MTGDLVKRLRRFSSRPIEHDAPAINRIAMEAAADRIEALTAENERLRATGAFLLARLDDLEWHDGQLEETARQYFGHVDPAIYHFRAALGDTQ